jgi:hypothetical protein
MEWMHFEYMFYLRVSDEEVRKNFVEAGVYDPNIYFVKGFFNETMPVLANMVHRLVLLRLDGDMYESTVDVLYRFYQKVSIGGYVFIDDWHLPAELATTHFFQVHNLTEELFTLDGNSVYWQKTKEVEVQFWRYEQKRFTPELSRLVDGEAVPETAPNTAPEAVTTETMSDSAPENVSVTVPALPSV